MAETSVAHAVLADPSRRRIRAPKPAPQVALLDAALARNFDDASDVSHARLPDAQGIGSGPDITPAVGGRPVVR